MAKTYTHLSRDQRYRIAALYESGLSQRRIATAVNTSPSTVCRELKRNAGKHGYRAKKACKKAKKRRFKASSVPRKMTGKTVDFIKEQLKTVQASPGQISGRMIFEDMISLSRATIYRFVNAHYKKGEDLRKHLRRKGKPYKQRKGKTAGKGLIPGRVGIEERPAAVEEKSRFGDFELDTVIGKNHIGSIVSIVDRMSKFALFVLLPDRTADNVTNAVVNALKNAGITPKTFTADNGKEFAQHALITEKTGAPVYFADPYKSWQRGLNEHTNGLLRQYFPKKTDFTKITRQDLQDAQNRLNNRPREILNYKTPAEALRDAI